LHRSAYGFRRSWIILLPLPGPLGAVAWSNTQ
jgi:hypothetical protein